MSITRRHVAAAGVLALAAAALPARAESADEAAVKKAVDDLGKAMIAADKAKLDALLSDQLSYGHSAGRLETKAIFMDVVAGKRTIYKSITLTEPTVAVAGNNAIARHTMAVETETDGKPSSAKVGVLQVWVKDGANWKLLARQAFRT
ncbi:nuclear transport factor 2 family protein [Reyranella sp.]|uniref:nuclear transport factor 2 family protein n=1 Tax=Reyranella sp. TaxID=1929291 RepID=UPI00378452A9